LTKQAHNVSQDDKLNYVLKLRGVEFVKHFETHNIKPQNQTNYLQVVVRFQPPTIVLILWMG